MEISEARWVVAIAGLLILVLTGIYCVKWVRDMALGVGGDSPATTEDYLSEFQRLRDEGKLAPEEFAKVAGLEPEFEPVDEGSVENTNESDKTEEE